MVAGEKLTKEQALIEIEEKGTFEEIDIKESAGIKDGYVIILGYDKKGNVIITDIQKDVGVRLTIKQEPVGYTNGKVEITIGLSQNKEQISSIETQEGMTKTENETYTVEKNGKYKIKAKLSTGATIEKEIIIATIDKKAPIEFTPIVTVDNGIIEITENGEDFEATEEFVKSGIDYYEYYVINEQNEETKYETNEITGLPTGKYKIYLIAYDKAGNYTTSEKVDAEVEEWIKIYNEEDLRNIANDLTKNYVLMNDITLTQVWIPLGNEKNRFTGKLDGAGYNISGLNNGNTSEKYQGLFGYVEEGKVSNLTLEGNITGGWYTGLLVGYNNKGTIENVKVSGTVVGAGYDIGGLVGNDEGGIIEKCYSEVSVSESGSGGNCYAGGLVGNTSKNSIIRKSVSIGTVKTNMYHVGGFVGENYGIIEDSYSTGEVSGKQYVGGFTGNINNYYGNGRIKNSYTISKVSGNSDLGGLAGHGSGVITNSYWTKEKSGVKTSTVGTELTLEQMKTQASYEGWDFINTWKMGESGFPELIFDFGKVNKEN